jgi:Glycosyl transferase family 2
MTGHRFDLLIATRPRRHEQLCTLLEKFDQQMQPGAGAIIYRDNQVESYGVACHTLVRASKADYVAFFDDDDWPAQNYIERIMTALESDPDYVGWPEIYTVDGAQTRIIVHSLADRSSEYPEVQAGDIVHKNPIKRELALLGTWSGQWGADQRWANEVRATGRVQTEVWISDPMYHYRFSTLDGGHVTQPPVSGSWPVIPSYDWLTVMDQ